MVENILDRLVPIFFLIPAGFTIHYYFPRYYNFSKYKTMQLIFLIGFLIFGILFIPLILSIFENSSSFTVFAFFVAYDSIILLLSFYLFRSKIDSTTIFFVTREDIKKLILDVLTRLDWTNIQVTDDHDILIFSDSDQEYTIQACERDDRFIVIPKVLGETNRIDSRILRRFSINLKFDLNNYPPIEKMVTIFRKKNLTFLILLWGLFIVLQIVRVFITRM